MPRRHGGAIRRLRNYVERRGRGPRAGGGGGDLAQTMPYEPGNPRSKMPRVGGGALRRDAPRGAMPKVDLQPPGGRGYQDDADRRFVVPENVGPGGGGPVGAVPGSSGRPWTQERMAAARPMPMPTATPMPLPSEPAPQGPAGPDPGQRATLLPMPVPGRGMDPSGSLGGMPAQGGRYGGINPGAGAGPMPPGGFQIPGGGLAPAPGGGAPPMAPMNPMAPPGNFQIPGGGLQPAPGQGPQPFPMPTVSLEHLVGGGGAEGAAPPAPFYGMPMQPGRPRLDFWRGAGR